MAWLQVAEPQLAGTRQRIIADDLYVGANMVFDRNDIDVGNALASRAITRDAPTLAMTTIVR
ncbi:MAG: hypothetical protein ACREB3_18320, partial [Burkholderiales bacterium]